MRRRKFSREFKVEAVKLVMERGVSVAQAAHENVLRKWVKDFGSDPVQAVPGRTSPSICKTSRSRSRACGRRRPSPLPPPAPEQSR
jgi:transposase-like protein